MQGVHPIFHWNIRSSCFLGLSFVSILKLQSLEHGNDLGIHYFLLRHERDQARCFNASLAHSGQLAVNAATIVKSVYIAPK